MKRYTATPSIAELPSYTESVRSLWGIATVVFFQRNNSDQCWPIRDLLRKRGHLVQIRTALINNLHLQGIISRNCSSSLNAGKIKVIKVNHILPSLSEQMALKLSGTVRKNCIDFLTRQVRKIDRVI